ncbi:MAG: prolipoprotein diacylglyceryl transferase [Evtepia gabavorous]
MLPYWNLGGTLFPTYSLLTLLGAAAAWLYFHRQLKARGENPGRTEQAFLFGVLGALVGAKFLYLLLQLPQLLQDLPVGGDPAAFFRPLPLGVRLLWRAVRRSGRVWLFCRRRKVPSQLGADLVPAVPLFHTFGRVGCFLAGCCYGIPAPAGWPGVTFRVSPVAPNGVALLPVQLYEAAGCLLLFLLLHRLARRGWKGEALLLVYLAAYALFRFALEFLRGDAARGMWGVFSTSQLLALVTLAAVLPLLIRHLRTYGKQPRL